MTVGRSPDLTELFSPRSVAVVGASNRVGSVGHALFRNVLSAGFSGVVYPVNPSWQSVSGVRCYRSVRRLPDRPDLGVVIVPAPAVAGVVDALGRRGARGVVVISSGFAETGAAGAALEQELVAVVRRHRMSIIGPNCFGVLNTDPSVNLNATFSDALPPRGGIAFVSQSGALCAGILRYGLAERIGFSRFVSFGNRAGVDENDLLAALGRDPATRVILLYVESLADGRRFLEVARRETERKPVLVIKSGRSAVGERAARSHTASLARSGQDRLYDALFQQSGVLRVDTLGELFRLAKAFSAGLRLDGPRVAIVTNSGGPGIVAADAGARYGLELPALDQPLQRALRPRLSPSASTGNPVDLTADATPAQYRRSLEVLLRGDAFDAALVIATPTGNTDAKAVARAILSLRGRTPKPLVACLFGVNDLSQEVGELETHGIPAYTFPEEAVQSLAAIANYQRWRDRPRTLVRRFRVDRAAARRALASARRAGLAVLPEFAARSVLEAYGVRFARSARASTRDEVLRAAVGLGFPVALKVASPDISHKSDVGGVALGLTDGAAVGRAFDTMRSNLARRAPSARIEGFEVEEMVSEGKEVLVGAQRDPAFGPLVVFGMGGVYVEVVQDVTFRLAPLRTLSAEHMVTAVRGFPILTGIRGDASSDLPALYEVIERVSQLIVELPEIAELDVNPLMVRGAGRGVTAVDARIVLGPGRREGV
ncbi:MAG TPA: acetate--CoA ligase family protein [Thermoplasmata archaeon]|nr:acetate--CoA ligase family protein [Thermoplasmata archaeon]